MPETLKVPWASSVTVPGPEVPSPQSIVAVKPAGARDESVSVKVAARIVPGRPATAEGPGVNG